MRRLGWTCAIIASVLAVLIVLPVPGWPLWLTHFIAVEASLGTALVAAIGVAAITRQLRRASTDKLPSWRKRTALFLSIVAGLVALAPVVSLIPAYRRAGQRFSFAEYLRGPAEAPVRVERDVVLAPEFPDLTADVYHATDPGTHPFVVVVHGGSWRNGDKGVGSHVSRALARAGFTVVDVRYHLAPAARFPQAVREVRCLLGRLRERAAHFGIDPQRGALLGRSAGGQIALVAAYSAGDARITPACAVADEPVQAVVSLYAPTDLAFGYRNPIHPDVIRGTDSLVTYLGGSPEQAPDAYRLGSPQSWVDHRLPPTLLIHGGADRLVRFAHAERLLERLRGHGQHVEYLPVALADHGFDMRPGGAGEQLARGAIVRFLRQALRATIQQRVTNTDALDLVAAVPAIADTGSAEETIGVGGNIGPIPMGRGDIGAGYHRRGGNDYIGTRLFGPRPISHRVLLGTPTVHGTLAPEAVRRVVL